MAPNKGTEVESHLVLEAGPDMSPIQRWWLGGRLQPVCRSISTVSIGCAIYHNYCTGIITDGITGSGACYTLNYSLGYDSYSYIARA